MIAQRNDHLLVDGERRRIAAAATLPFSPNRFGLRLGGSPAAECHRGFWVDFELDGDTLKIRELWIAPHPQDRESLFQGRLLGCLPNAADESSMTFHHMTIPYSGKLLVDGHETLASGSPQELHEIFVFEDGRLRSRENVKLRKLPHDYTPSSIWLDYGVMLWVLPDPSELENA